MQRALKILIAHYRPDIVSGAENSLADFMDRTGDTFQFTMLAPAEGRLADFYRKRGYSVWVRDVPGPRWLRPGLHQVHSWLFSRELQRQGFDAVLCNTFPAAGRVGTACQLADIPHAIYIRDYLPDRPVYRKMLRRARAIFTISNDVRSHLRGMVDMERVFLAYNYINPEPVLARRAAHAAKAQRLLPFPGHPVIGLVGRITPYKQPDLLIRAIPHILAAHPEARFVLIGAAQAREKPYEASIQALASELGVSEQIAFLGQRGDAIELTAELAIACLTSGREPLGRVILEAHLLDVPVVVPDTGGPAEIVIDGVTGLHFNSQSTDAPWQLAGQVIRLLNNPNLRSCLVNNARERMAQTFAGQEHVSIQERYIEQLCKGDL